MSSTPSLPDRFDAACRLTPPSTHVQSFNHHVAASLRRIHPLVPLPTPDFPPTSVPTPSQLLQQRDVVLPNPQLSSLTWANSRSRQVLLHFITECKSTPHQQPSHPPGNNPLHPTKPPSHVDPVVWAAQEHAAASAVLRDIRALHARRKAAPPLLSARKLKPEAAAEMARARVAAAAAAAVMKEHAAASTVLTSADTPQAAHPRFRRSFSQANRHKKHVHFADDTVFKPTQKPLLP